MEKTENRLLRSIEEQISSTYIQYQELVYRFALNRVRDEDEAKDITQQTFLKATIAIRGGKYRENQKMGSWLMAICNNLCMDYFRKKKNRAEVSINNSGDNHVDIDLEDQELNIEEVISNKDVGDVLWQIVKNLSEEQIEVLLLRHKPDGSKPTPFKVIAEKQGVSINTSIGRMRHALTKMRKIIRERGLELDYNRESGLHLEDQKLFKNSD